MIGNVNFQDPFAHGAYITWDGGMLKFDTVDNETVVRDADIVEHPVETGANIADHYRVKLNSIELEAFVSQEPLDTSIYPDAQGSVQGVTLSLPQYPSALGAAAVPTLAVGSAITSTIQRPPTEFTQRVLMYSNPIDTLATVLGVLEDLRTSATLVDVATRSWYYASMLISNVTTKRNAGTGSGTIITVSLRQVIFVSTDAVPLPPKPKKPKDKPSANKGKQNPTPADKTALKWLADWLAGGNS